MDPYESPRMVSEHSKLPLSLGSFLKRRRLFVVVSAAFIVFLVIWLGTIESPGRFVFLPGGDVGLGFRSYAGQLEWIEYAPWGPPEYCDNVLASIPWWKVLVTHGTIVGALAWRSRERRSTQPTLSTSEIQSVKMHSASTTDLDNH
jgi:hypothetical protein